MNTSEVLANNVYGCRALAELVKPTLGPYGLDIQLPSGQRTNDGAQILRSLPLQHPAAKFLVELSMAQDELVGDGTTSVVILTGELLHRALDLVSKGVPIHVINQGLRLALQRCNEVLDAIAINITDENRRSILTNIAKTSMNSKIIGEHSNMFANMVVEAVSLLGNRPKIGNIKILSVTGPSMEATEFIKGFAMKNRVGLGCPKKIQNAKILLSKMSLERGGDDSEDQRNRIRESCEKIVASGATVVVNRGYIYNVAEQVLAAHGIMFIENVSNEELDQLALSAGGFVVEDVRILSPICLGSAELIEEIVLGDERIIKFTGCPTTLVNSILVRAPSASIVHECETSLHDALSVTIAAINAGKVLGGGGSVYIELSKVLKEESLKYKDKLQLVFEAFSTALECIPFTLASNGGLDGATLISELKLAHHEGEVWRGLDLFHERTMNVIEGSELSPPLLEPEDLMRTILALTVECVDTILRIQFVEFETPYKSFVLS
jgi:T-complex protein 1 subunit beta